MVAILLQWNHISADWKYQIRANKGEICGSNIIAVDHIVMNTLIPTDLPRSRLSLPKSETQHSFQRCFNGTRHSPRSVKWVAQWIQEDEYESSQAALANWVHKKRQVEVSRVTIDKLNQLSDNDIVKALQELKKPKHYVQGSGGQKLTMHIIISTLDKNRTVETKALLDSGCTGLCVDRSFIKRNWINTCKLVRPIPIYNADGTLNKNGAITETVALCIVIQDHVEWILFAIGSNGIAVEPYQCQLEISNKVQ
jgi:hypothetical protein